MSTIVEPVPSGLTRELGGRLRDWVPALVVFVLAIALWQGLLNEGLYVNLIVPPGCPQDECVLRASCSAAHTPEQIERALGILARVGAELGVTDVALS